MNPKVKNIFIVSGVVAGVIALYLIYRNISKSNEGSENTFDESKVNAESKSNILRVYR